MRLKRSINEALSDEAKANNEMIQKILNKRPSQLTAKEKKFLTDNDLVRFANTGSTPSVGKSGSGLNARIYKGADFVTHHNSYSERPYARRNINDVDQLNLLKKRKDRSDKLVNRINAKDELDILEPITRRGDSLLQDFNQTYQYNIKKSNDYADATKRDLDSYAKTGDREYANSAQHYADVSRMFRRHAKDSLEYRPKFESLNEASYGGAFDIEDDMFFTKDDLMEFAYDLEEKFKAWSEDPNAEISDVYMTTPTHLVMEIMSEGAGHEAQVDIDMRRIRRPRDVDKYGDQILAQWKDSYIQYNGDPDEVLDESYDESTIKDYFNDAWDKYADFRDAVYAFANAVEGNKNLEIAAYSFITNVEEAAGDFWSDYDYYLNSEDETEEE